MITKHNISSLFEFVKKQKKSNILRIDLINKSFVLSQHSKTNHILIDKNGVNFNCKIEKKINEIAQILLPILMIKKKFYIGQIGQSLDGKIALLNGNSLENKLLDIMQFIIAPTIIGSGINSINIKPITNLKKVIRTKNKIYKFGEEMIVSLEF